MDVILSNLISRLCDSRFRSLQFVPRDFWCWDRFNWNPMYDNYPNMLWQGRQKRFRVNWCHHHQSISTCKFLLSNVLKVNLWTSPMQQQSSPKRCDKMSKEWALIEMFTREMQTKHARVRTNFNTEGLFGVRLGWRWEMRYVNYVNDKITEMHTKWEKIFLSKRKIHIRERGKVVRKFESQ